ncbi:MAG: anaerobic ribonucleoside-triphosphate reductase activating protein [Clostridia bacterium]|nr:anaerobic ribonucleoside-triphosphate reductase activating protein [Clostridia bacterium]
MLIKGLQKLTLLDYPTKTACTIFTGGCNFRCPFCHNASLVLDVNEGEKHEADEVLAFLGKRVGLLDGVCVTGGEPLLQKDIKEFLKAIKEMGYAIKLDTNGYSPEKLMEIVEEGLIDYVAMDIKNCKEKYSETAGIDIDMAKIEKSVSFLMNSGIDYEFRTTVVKEYHTLSDIEKIAGWISGAKRYFLQSFVDSGDLIKDGLSAVDKETLDSMKNVCTWHIKNTETRGV